MTRITLPTWLAQNYGADDAPTLNTARRWAKTKKLTPPALKEGRTYYVYAHTRYTADATNPDQPRNRLLERVLAARAARSEKQGSAA